MNPRRVLRIAGILSLAVYVVIDVLSRQFGAETELHDRPILITLTLFVVAFAAYAVAARQVLTHESMLGWREVFLWGLLFRLVVWPSVPIQEVDLYRYIWDGAVSQEGVDPYRYPPEQVIDAAQQPSLPNTSQESHLRRLVRIYQDRPGLRRIADQVHFGFLTTPYPPVSQAVFRFAHGFCSDDASEYSYVLAFKAVILLFDIATALTLVAMLRFFGRSPALVLVYWWCPLVIKEFANSGHLDSIAVSLLIGSAFLMLKGCFPPKTPSADPDNRTAGVSWTPFVYSLLSALLLALAVGAKLFPLVLVPLWVVSLLRRRRSASLLPIAAFGLVTVIVCWPMIAQTEFVTDRMREDNSQLAATEVRQPAVTDAPSGIEAFYRYWEMNDLVFLVVVENLKPAAQLNGQPPAWFLVTSERWRSTTHKTWRQRLNIPENEVAFVLTRYLLIGVYLCVVAGICVSVWRNPTPRTILNGSFLTLAWLWFLGPVQNPWYWTWAIPFLPFVRNRAWLAVSGLAFPYYLRFWFEGHFLEATVLSTPYTGLRFFDFVIPWIEFGPWMVVLFVTHRRNRKSSESDGRSTP